MMIQLITGGQTMDTKGAMLDIVKQVPQEKNILIITPEQFSFELERELYHKVDVSQQRRLTVTAFTRLAHKIFKELGGVCSSTPDEVSKIIVMRQAVKSVETDLVVYKNNVGKIDFITQMLTEITGLQQIGIMAIDLETASHELAINKEKNDTKFTILKDKMNDLSLIYSTYELLIEKAYEQPQDSLTKAVELVKNSDYFKNTTVFMYNFNGFIHPQYSMISQMLESGSDIYVTLILEHQNSEEIDFFTGVQKTYNKLFSIAKTSQVPFMKPIECITPIPNVCDEIKHIECNIFRQTQEKFVGENNNVQLVLCKNEYDEVNYVASRIFELVYEQGYRFRDIVVSFRDAQLYAPKLEKAFERYNIAYCMDANESLHNKLVVQFIKILFSVINTSFSPNSVLTLLKTGLMGYHYTNEQIGAFENYLFIWDVKGSGLKKPFIYNPLGMKPFDDKSTKLLEEIEQLRQQVLTPLMQFAEDTKQAVCDGKTISALVFQMLCHFKVKETITQISEDYAKIGDIYNANLTGRVWNLCMDALDKLAIGVGDTKISLEEYARLFDIVVNSYDFGVIEQTLDCVIVTQTQRMRVNNPKIVMVLGVNEGVFPYVAKPVSIFTDTEKKLLMDLEMTVPDTEIEMILQERFYAYQVLSLPTNMLLLTARKLDLSGTVKRPSIVTTQLISMFGKGVVIDSDDLPKLSYCKTPQTTFEYLAKNYHDNSVENASIKKALEKNVIYANKLKHIEYSKQTRETTLQNKEKAKQLFGNNLKISPSRVENYYKCPFLYFCQFGLKITPLVKAKYSPILRGNLVHMVVEQVYNEIKHDNQFETASVNTKIDIYFNHYLNEIIGEIGADNKEQNRIIHTLGRFKKAVHDIVQSIYEEQKQSCFKITDTEYDIGGDNSDVPPLSILLDSGGSVEIYGRIDRIDTYVNEKDEKYVRVIDYKTGSKKFKLTDVLHGMNMQMLIYLFSIVKKGQGRYAGYKPAGVLYFPARAVKADTEHQVKVVDDTTVEINDNDVNNAGDGDDYTSKRIKTHLMNGIVVADIVDNEIDLSIVRAMEEDISSKFVPVKLKKDASVSVSSGAIKLDKLYKGATEVLQTPEQMEKIYTYIESKIKHMGEQIHMGDISEGRIKDVCQYCEYGRICTVDQRENLFSYSEIDLDELYK